MKRFMLLISVSLLILWHCVPANADTGDIIGKLYATDIIAEVNGFPVPSYNIGGKTVIILEDLGRFNANPYYHENLRTLTVNTDYLNMQGREINMGTSGQIIGDVYESDITVYLNGKRIQAFSLNGKMAVAVEDMGDDNSLSPYNAKYIWNEANRTISLSFCTTNQLPPPSLHPSAKVNPHTPAALPII